MLYELALLIALLNSDDFQTREASSKYLTQISITYQLWDYMEIIAKTKDNPEVSSRLKRISYDSRPLPMEKIQQNK